MAMPSSAGRPLGRLGCKGSSCKAFCDSDATGSESSAAPSHLFLARQMSNDQKPAKPEIKPKHYLFSTSSVWSSLVRSQAHLVSISPLWLSLWTHVQPTHHRAWATNTFDHDLCCCCLQPRGSVEEGRQRKAVNAKEQGVAKRSKAQPAEEVDGDKDDKSDNDEEVSTPARKRSKKEPSSSSKKNKSACKCW